ncbi:MAG: isochorismate synthase [bacterium]|nr:isochorismate synthase [bacterium]
MLQTTEHLTLVKSLRKQIQQPELEAAFTESIAQEKRFFSISFSIEPVDVLAAIEQLPNKDTFQYYWEKPTDEFSIAAAGELKRITQNGESRFRDSSTNGKTLLNQVYHVKGLEHQNATVHLFGGFSFFDENNASAWSNFGAASFTLPEWMIIRDGKCTILTVTFPISSADSIEQLQNRLFEALTSLEPVCNVGEYKNRNESHNHVPYSVKVNSEFQHLHWVESVKRAKKCIEEGTFEKVVLARELRLEVEKTVSETQILHKLRRQYPDCYSFLIRQDSSACFIGSTPERLAAFQSNFILTEGLAGSTSRGKSATEDAVLEHNLLQSTKDLHEHEIVLDAIEERLNPFTENIKHPKSPGVKKLSNVQHLFTPITATIKQGVSRTEVMKNLHPTPAVGGYPREKAVEFIRQHEDFDRGWYAAPIGWINANGNGEFVVAIRSGLIMEKEVRFFAGCGIVQDSDPNKEWEETNMKFIPMLSALNYAGS